MFLFSSVDFFALSNFFETRENIAFAAGGRICMCAPPTRLLGYIVLGDIAALNDFQYEKKFTAECFIC